MHNRVFLYSTQCHYSTACMCVQWLFTPALHYRRLVLCRAGIRVPLTTSLPPSGEEVDHIGGRVGGSANKKVLNRSRTFCVERTCG